MLALSVVIMGASAMLLQVTVLRRLLTVFSGNELDIGITLAVWLAAVGAGGAAARRHASAAAFPGSFTAVALLAIPTLLGIGLVRPLSGAAPGETIALPLLFLATLLTLVPLCFAIGYQFPLAAVALGGAGKTYGLDAAGAFLGGTLHALVLAGRTDAAQLVLAVSLVNGAAAWLLSRDRKLLFLAALPLLFFAADRAQLLPADREVLTRVESRYGEIEVRERRGQYAVFASGRFRFAYPDPSSEQLAVHPVLTLHPRPASVLVVGGPPAAMREALQHPVERLEHVEIDPALTRVARGLLDASDRRSLDDPRAAFHAVDARRFLREAPDGRYDLVLLALGGPSTANANRFYTVEFFREVRRVLAPDGLLAVSLPPAYGYTGRALARANGSVAASLAAVFREVVPSSAEYGLLAASDTRIDTRPGALAERYRARGIDAPACPPELFRDLFDPERTAAVRARFSASDAVNTDDRPVAYLYSLMVWLDMHGGGAAALPEHTGALLAAVLAALAAAAITLRGSGRTAAFSIGLTGASSMAVSLVLLLSYQAHYGSVYEDVGLLAALFMAGMGLGPAVADRIARPLTALRAVQTAALPLFAAAALITARPAFFLLNLAAGVLAGAEFSFTARIRPRRHPVTAGTLYAADLMGSALGALLTALVLMPVLGIARTLAVVACVKIVSLSALFSLNDENA